MKNSRRFWRTLLFTLLIAALGGSFALPVVNTTVQAAPQLQAAVSHLVISQVYGGGGNPGATYTNDFIELFNLTDAAVPMDGWSVQYANATDTTFSIAVNLSGSLDPGKYFLIQLASAATIGNALPAPDMSGTIDLDAAAGKVILANTITPISCSSSPCPPSGLAGVIDLVGYGTTADSYEGTGASPAPSASTAVLRNGSGCTDTDNNDQDFTASTPAPRNVASSTGLSCSAQVTGTASAVNATASVVNATATASAVNATATASVVNATATASAVHATSTAVALTNTSTASLKVVINEVAWSGTSAATPNDEWIELYNPSSLDVDITGWSLYGDDNTANKVGSPNITLKGKIPAHGYFLLETDEAATNFPSDQLYSAGGDLLNSGERLYLKNGTGTLIDTANLDGGSWPAGSTSYASMERVAGTNTWVTYAGTQPIAYDRNGGAIKGTPRSENWINSATITTITSDLPDPSLTKQDVTVSVSVIGGRTIPTGAVNITGANTNCSIVLSASGTGSCKVNFTSTGTKTLIASYIADATHFGSSDTESHQVTASTVRTPTPVPSPLPPPPLLAINEFVPRPGHDWNHDGVVNTGDEYIEVLNHGVVNVNLSGYSLDDEVNVGSDPYKLPALTLRPGERYVFYGSETGLLLGDGGDAVRLMKPNGQLADAYNYSVVERPDQSFCRLPDNGGADDWNTNCYPTPGLQNSLNEGSSTTSSNTSKELYCPIADTLPDDFAQAECEPFGNEIWNPDYWNQSGWYGDQYLPGIESKWRVFAN
jgi:hypothetical protein